MVYLNRPDKRPSRPASGGSTMDGGWRRPRQGDDRGRLVGGVGMRRGRPTAAAAGRNEGAWSGLAAIPDRGTSVQCFVNADYLLRSARPERLFVLGRADPVRALVFSRVDRAIGRRAESEQVRNGKTTAGENSGGHRLTTCGRIPPPAPALPPDSPSTWHRTTADSLRRFARRPFRAAAPRPPRAGSDPPVGRRTRPGR